MKTKKFSYKIARLMMALLLSFSTITGAEYRGDQPKSPVSRFLYGLFHSKPVKSSGLNHPQGKTYSYSYLSQGHIKSSKNNAQENTYDLSDIWSTKTNAGLSMKVISSSRSDRPSHEVKPGSTVSSSLSILSANATVLSPSASSASFALGDVSSSSFSASFGNSINLFSRQNAPAETQDDGGSDPGGDPEGPPLPVGDGVWVLLILAIGYVVLRRHKLFQPTE